MYKASVQGRKKVYTVNMISESLTMLTATMITMTTMTMTTTTVYQQWNGRHGTDVNAFVNVVNDTNEEMMTMRWHDTTIMMMMTKTEGWYWQ